MLDEEAAELQDRVDDFLARLDGSASKQSYSAARRAGQRVRRKRQLERGMRNAKLKSYESALAAKAANGGGQTTVEEAMQRASQRVSKYRTAMIADGQSTQALALGFRLRGTFPCLKADAQRHYNAVNTWHKQRRCHSQALSSTLPTTLKLPCIGRRHVRRPASHAAPEAEASGLPHRHGVLHNPFSGDEIKTDEKTPRNFEGEVISDIHMMRARIQGQAYAQMVQELSEGALPGTRWRCAGSS